VHTRGLVQHREGRRFGDYPRLSFRFRISRLRVSARTSRSAGAGGP
jgi:hypothetical protein